MQSKNKARWVLIALILCFILPMLLAHYYYRHPGLLRGHTNRGQLINPPLLLKNLSLRTVGGQPFDESTLQKKWAVMYLSSAPCTEACQQNLYKMRQVRTATNKERERVNRLLVFVTDTGLNETERNALNGVIAENYPDTLVASVTPQQWLAFAPQAQLPESGYFYLVDPLGNIILHYPGDINPADLFKDLKHLLQISQIG